ncbi:MAG TPA: efflux RND transporter permease subunit, partial [Planctomycetota bacterium]|nr:efflux RND transporter permease subunit [Planctomycetota bacterium]
MRLSRQAIHRPVFTVMLTLIVIILGGVSLYRLPVDLMPDITFPSLSISTDYEGASPEEIEELVTRPIEQALAAVPGVEEISSASVEGSSRVRISFTWGTDLAEAASDVRDRLDRVIPRLPEDASRPRLWKFDLASFPVLILGASSDLDPIELRRIIDDDVKYRIERITGVAALDIWGGLEREIHVNLNPDKIEALRIPLNQIIQRILESNVNVAAGELETGNLEVTVRTPGEYANLEQLRNTVIASPDGVPVALREVADVEDTWQKVRQVVRVNGRPGIRLSVNKQSGTNTVDVARACLAEIEKINRDIPQIEITPIIDSSEYIQRSITNISSMAVYGGGLAVLVLLVFLRSVRSTAIIATAIPISIIATFALLYFGGLTLNIMTLGGLAHGNGKLIDNSIVVLENIYRLRETGQTGIDAAVNGSEEVTSAIIASTLTTIVVFLPVVFIRGMAGVMFSQMAFVVGFALLCSLVVALTLVPMLAARLLPAPKPERAHPTLGHQLFLATGFLFKSLENGYKGFIHFALNQRLLVTVVAAAALTGSFFLVRFIGAEFMPQSDEGEVRVDAEAEVGSRLGLLDERIREIESIVRASVPEIKSMVAR